MDKEPRDKIPIYQINLRQEASMVGRYMRTVFGVAIVALLVIGCASPAEQQAYVRRISDRELCMSWMTSAPLNQYQGARLGEIQRRGLDCRKYGNVAEEQRKARADFQDAVNRLSGQQKANRVQVPMGITNCMNRGAGVFTCEGPRGMVSCTDRGIGVLSCQ